MPFTATQPGLSMCSGVHVPAFFAHAHRECFDPGIGISHVDLSCSLACRADQLLSTPRDIDDVFIITIF